MQRETRGKIGIGYFQQILDFYDILFSAAQVNALNATPLVIIPSPGPNLALVLEGVLAYYTKSTAFTIGSATGLAFKYTDAAGLQLAQVAVTGFIDQATNQLRYVQSYRAASGASGFTPAIPNAPIVANTLTADVSGGSGSTIKFRSYFRRVPVVL